VLEHRADVVGNADHGARTDRLDTGLLDGIEHGPCLLPCGREPGMEPAIAAGALQRRGIARPAGDAARASARPLSQPGPARTVARQRRAILGEGDLHLVVARDGAHADGHGPLEDVAVTAALALVARIVSGTRHLPSLLGPPRGARPAATPGPRSPRSPAVP